MSEGRVRYCWPAYPCCSENQIAVSFPFFPQLLAAGTGPVCAFWPTEEDRQYQYMIWVHQTIPPVGFLFDEGRFVSRGFRVCFVILLWAEDCQTVQAGTLTFEAQGVPSEPSSSKPGIAWTSRRWSVPVNVVRSRYIGLFVHVQISLSRSDVPRSVELLALMLSHRCAHVWGIADCWMPNWDSFLSRKRGCICRSLLPINLTENGERMKE